jgi:(R,R)-butanediol dehydrogenase/meso-butanediol dehydrogenase/diacetyl reductase
MRAAVFHRPGQKLDVTEVEQLPLRDGDVTLEVYAVGVCGSDLHATQEGAFLQEDGTVLGHEFAGKVVDSKDPEVPVGLRATVVPVDICDECRPLGHCKFDLGAVCPHSNFTGLARHVPGAFAEKVRVLGKRVVPLPDGVSYEEGAVVEPLAVGLHAVDMADISIGQRVLIIGAGPIGLSVATFAALAGAGAVIVSEFSESRRQMVGNFGATGTIDPGEHEDVASRFVDLAGGAPDIVFDCVGVPGTLQSAIDIAPARATVVVVGVCMKPDEILPLSAALKELRIQFVMAYSDEDFSRVLSLIAAGRLDAEKMITNRVSLDDLPVEFEKLRTPSDQIKLMVAPQD